MSVVTWRLIGQRSRVGLLEAKLKSGAAALIESGLHINGEKLLGDDWLEKTAWPELTVLFGEYVFAAN